MIYFIYEPMAAKETDRWIEHVGNIFGFNVGKVDESLLPYITMIDCMVIPEKVAMAYKFCMKRVGYINVRLETTQYEQLDKDKLEPYKDKFKYYLTDEDKHYAHLFEKAIMHCMLNKYYNNLGLISISTPESLREGLSWKSLEELKEKRQKMIDKIDACTNMDETATILNDHFGVQKNPDKNTEKIDM